VEVLYLLGDKNKSISKLSEVIETKTNYPALTRAIGFIDEQALQADCIKRCIGVFSKRLRKVSV